MEARYKVAFGWGVMMIPAVIGDLQERVPSEELVSGWTSRHCGTSPHIDFDHHRPRTTSHVRPKVAKLRHDVSQPARSADEIVVTMLFHHLSQSTDEASLVGLP